MQDFKSLLRYIIEGEMNTDRKPPESAEEHINQINSVLDDLKEGRKPSMPAIQITNLFKYMHEGKVGAEKHKELFDRAFKIGHAPVHEGLSQNAHLHDDEYEHYREALENSRWANVRKFASSDRAQRVLANAGLLAGPIKYKPREGKEDSTDAASVSQQPVSTVKKHVESEPEPEISKLDPNDAEISAEKSDSSKLHQQHITHQRGVGGIGSMSVVNLSLGVKGKPKTNAHVGTIIERRNNEGAKEYHAYHHPYGDSSDHLSKGYSKHATLVDAIKHLKDRSLEFGKTPTGMKTNLGHHIYHGDKVQYNPTDEEGGNETGTVISGHHHSRGEEIIKVHGKDGKAYLPASLITHMKDHRPEASFS